MVPWGRARLRGRHKDKEDEKEHGEKHGDAQDAARKTIYDDYSILAEIGHGAYSRVYKALHRESDELVAIKVMAVDPRDAEMQHIVDNEVRVMERVRDEMQDTCETLCQIREVVPEPGRVSIVMEFLAGGELFDRIVERKTFSESDACAVLVKLVHAVQALHEHGIIHRDIKPENIVYADSSDDTIKLMDFGLALCVGEDDPHQTIDYVGSPGYVAPEVISGANYGPENDVWSIGVLLYILLSGRPPFTGITPDEQSEKIVRGDYSLRGSRWKNVSSSAKDLVQAMLTVNTFRRITLDQVLEHPFVLERGSSDPLSGTLEELRITRDRRNVRLAAERALGRSSAELRAALMRVLEDSSNQLVGLSPADIARILKALDGARAKGRLGLADFEDLVAGLRLGDKVPAAELFDVLAHPVHGLDVAEPSVEIDELVVGISVILAKETRDRVLEYLFERANGATNTLYGDRLSTIISFLASYDKMQEDDERRPHVAYSIGTLLGNLAWPSRPDPPPPRGDEEDEDASSSASGAANDEAVTFRKFKQGVIELGEDIMQDLVVEPARSFAETVTSLDHAGLARRPAVRRITDYLQRITTYSRSVYSSYRDAHSRTRSQAPRRRVAKQDKPKAKAVGTDGPQNDPPSAAAAAADAADADVVVDAGTDQR